MKTIDLICIGEILIDCIGHEMNATIQNTQSYQRYLGGSPTNLAQNAARLGMHVALVASCGNDGLGDFVVNELQEQGISTQYLRRCSEPTSLILVSRSTNTPDFIAYRSADCQLSPAQISNETLAQARIFHTTCFALSKNPAQAMIIEKAKVAHSLGLQVSIDFNYSEKIWPNKSEAQAVLAEYLSFNPLVKISVDDVQRYFGELKSDAFVFDYFHALGVQTICYTKGKNGVTVSDKVAGQFHQSAIPISEIKDATGAGDAFWTGFLYGKLHAYSLQDCVSLAQKLAGIKLQNIGTLPIDFDFQLQLNS